MLVFLSIVTALYYWNSNRSATAADFDTFRVNDLTSIDEVILEHANKTVALKYDGIRWNVNGELADRNLIDVLFATLQQMKIIRPVATAIQDSLQAELQKSGVRVKLLSEGNTELAFIAGGDTRKSKAFFQKANQNTVYMMAIPGYRVYVSGIFELPAHGWRDKHVFQLNWRNFAGMQVRYPQSPQDNFDVAFMQNYFSIEGMVLVDTTRLNDFLDAISYLTVDGFGDTPVLAGSSGDSDLQVIYEAKDVGGKTYSLGLYAWRPDDTVIKGIINSTHPVFFERKRLNPILRTRDFFASK